METPNIKLKKFDLKSEPNTTMNVETYFNNNWDKIDEKAGDFNDLTERVTELESLVNNSNTKDVVINSPVTSFPTGTKGLFSPRIEGVRPLYNLIDNGEEYGNWTLSNNAIANKDGLSLKDSSIASARITLNNLLNKVFTIVIIAEVTNSLTVHTSGTQHNIFVDTVTNSGIHTRRIDANTWQDGTKLRLYSMDAKAKVMIYEGDQTNNPNILQAHDYGLIPCAQSYDLVNRGKNKFDEELSAQSGSNSIAYWDGKIHYKANKGNSHSSKPIKVQLKPNTVYTPSVFNFQGVFESSLVATFVINNVNNFRSFESSSHDLSFTTDSTGNVDFYFTSGGSNTQINVSFNFMLVEGIVAPSTYIPYTSSTATFTVPKDYPLVELPNGTGNAIGENGDYEVACEYKKDVHLQTEWSINAKQTIHMTFQTTNSYLTGNTSSEDVGTRLLNIGNKVFSIVPNLNTADTAWSYTIYDKDLYINIPRTELETDDVDGLKKWLEGKGSSNLIYKLSTPFTIKDGEQGYKAPTSIQAYENGDLVVQGIYENIHEPDSTDNKTIELQDELLTLESVHTIDGKALDAELQSNCKTIKLSKEYNNKVLVKGLLKQETYLYPIIKGSLPTNLGTLANNNSKVLSETNEKIAVLEDQLDFCVDFIKKLSGLVNNN